MGLYNILIPGELHDKINPWIKLYATFISRLMFDADIERKYRYILLRKLAYSFYVFVSESFEDLGEIVYDTPTKCFTGQTYKKYMKLYKIDVYTTVVHKR